MKITKSIEESCKLGADQQNMNEGNKSKKKFGDLVRFW